MATIKLDSWGTAAAPSDSSWQIPPGVQAERDRVRKQMLEDELAQEQALADKGDRVAAQNVERLQREIGNDVRAGRYGRDEVANPFVSSTAPAGGSMRLAQWAQQPTDPYEALYPTYRESAPGPRTRNPAAVLNDWVINAANAVLSGAAAIIDFAQPGTQLAQDIENLVRLGEERQSDVTRQARQELQQSIDEGGWEAARGVGRYALTSPGLVASELAGMIAPVGGAMGLAGRAARVAGYGARGVQAAQLGASTLYGAASAGGDAAGDAYQMTYQGMIQQGYSPEQADEVATRAAREASVVPAALGGIGGRFGMEAAMAGRATGGVIRTGLKEALQQGAEEGITTGSANIAAGQYVPGIDPYRGVVGSAALGGVFGALGGGYAGYGNRNQPRDLLQEPLRRTQGELFDTPLTGMASPLRQRFTDLADTRDDLRSRMRAAEEQPGLVDPLEYREMRDSVERIEQILAGRQLDQLPLEFEQFNYRPSLQGRKERGPVGRTALQRDLLAPEIAPDAPKDLLIPGQYTPTAENIELPQVSTQEAYARAIEKAKRGEPVTQLERYLLENPPEMGGAVLRPETGAGAMQQRMVAGPTAFQPVRTEPGMRTRVQEPSQMDMLGKTLMPMEGAATNAAPFVQPPATFTNAQQPGQGELFGPGGAPTYQAAPPDVNTLAEARLRAEGATPTQKRMEIAVRAEDALAAGTIDEPTYDQVFALLRESKYARANKLVGEARVPQAAQTQQAAAQRPQAPAAPAAEAAPTVAEPVVAPAQEKTRASVPATTVSQAKGKTPLQRRAAFGKALSAVVQSSGHFVRGRINKPLAKAMAAGDSPSVLESLSKSKSPIIRRIAELAAGKDFTVRIDDDAIEEYDRHAQLSSDTAAITIRVLDTLRSVKAEVEAYKGPGLPSFFDVELFPENFRGNQNARSSLSNYLYSNRINTKEEFLAHLAEQDKLIADEDSLRRAAEGTFRAIGVQGTYDPRTRTITTTEYAADEEHTVAHELVHLLTVDTLAKPTPRQRVTVQKLRNLYDAVKVAKIPSLIGRETTPIADRYGVTSLDEFVAEGLSNPDFQQQLSEIAYQNTTAWGKFTQFIADLLGLKNDNAFTELLALTEELAGTTQETENAVQVESPAEVPVQPRAEAGARVGKEVRSAEKPATEGKQAEAQGQAKEVKLELPKGVLTRKQAVDQLVRNGVSETSARDLVQAVSTGYGTVRAIDLRKALIAGINTKRSGQPPVYSRGAKAAGSTAAQVESWLKPVQRLWANAAPTKIVSSVKDLPADVAKDAPADAKGLFYKGEVYIVAENHSSQEEAQTTLFHEMIGHYGLRSLIRPESTEYVRVMTRIENQNKQLRDAAAEWRKNNPSNIGYLKKEFGYTDTMIRAVSVEEAMADMAYSALQNPRIREKLAKSPMLRTMVNWIANALRAVGMTSVANKVSNLTDNLDVFNLLSLSRNFVERGQRTTILSAQTVPMFSRGGETEASQFAPTYADYGKAIAETVFSKAGRGLMGFRFLRNLKTKYGSKIDGLNTYVEKAFAMGAMTNELLKEGGQIVNRWGALGKEVDDINRLASYATSMEIHPDIPLDKSQHISNGRKITNAHLVDAEGNVSDEVEAAHEKLSAMWQKLSPEAKKVFLDARDYMQKTWMQRQDLLNKNVDTVFKPLIDEAKRVGNNAKVKSLQKERNKFIGEFGTLLAQVKGPYFPLMRFGNFYVSYKSAEYKAAESTLEDAKQKLADLYSKHDVPMDMKKEITAAEKALSAIGEDPALFGLTKETREEIKQARAEMKKAQSKVDALVKEGEKHYTNESYDSETAARIRAKELGVEVRLAEEYYRELSPVTRGMIEKLTSAVGDALPQDQAIKAREAMVQIYLTALPQTSALKSQIRRKGIAGASQDMLRAFSSHTQKDAHYLSRLAYMDDMTAELSRMRGGRVTTDQYAIYNEMARRHAASLQYHQTPIQDGLSSLAFIYQLGVSPAFLLANMTQPFMISMPYMSGKHGLNKPRTEMFRAFADAGKAAAASMKEQGFRFEIDLNKFKGDEKAMLENAMREGLLDITLEMDIGAYAKGGSGKFSRAMQLMGVLPHQVEVVNRVSTALAAYRLEVAAGKSSEDATAYAKQVLDKTHFDYSSTNAPYLLKAGVVPFGKLLFQYRKYQLGMLTLMGQMTRDAFKGATAAERAQAKRALFGTFATYGLVTGVTGMPFVGTAFFIAKLIATIFGDEDEPQDPEAEFRKYLAEVFGTEGGLAVAKGLPALLGMDLSRILGAGDIAAPIRSIRWDKDGRDLYSEILIAGLGPTIGGLGPQFAEGIRYILAGDYYRGAQNMLPRVIRDGIKAAQMSDEGVTTAKGQQVIEPDDIEISDIMLQAFGIPTTFVTERQAAVRAIEGAKEAVTDRRMLLIRKFVKARVDGDAEAMQEAREAIDKFNQARREKGEPMIKWKDLTAAYKQRRTYAKNMNQYGVSLRKNEQAFNEYGEFAEMGTGEE